MDKEQLLGAGLGIFMVIIILGMGFAVMSNLTNCFGCQECAKQNFKGNFTFSGDLTGTIDCGNQSFKEYCSKTICDTT